jgi:hypothetical protein
MFATPPLDGTPGRTGPPPRIPQSAEAGHRSFSIRYPGLNDAVTDDRTPGDGLPGQDATAIQETATDRERACEAEWHEQLEQEEERWKTFSTTILASSLFVNRFSQLFYT